MTATRSEIVDHVAAAFGHGRVERDDLVGVARESGARDAVLQVLAQLPLGPFDDVRELWLSLPGVPIESTSNVRNR